MAGDMTSMLCHADVPLFGASGYDPKNERPDDVTFEMQLEGLANVVKAGKVRNSAQHAIQSCSLLLRAASNVCLPWC